MGMMDRISAFMKPQERRSQDVSWDAIEAISGSGQAVNARVAENLSTVIAAVQSISGAIASLPVWVFRRTPDGRELDENHPLAAMVRNGPNRHQTWCDFLEWLVASTLLRGNGLAEIVTDQRGKVTELRPIQWEWVSVQLLPNGRLAYDVTEAISIHGGQGRKKRLLQGEVLHLKDRSDDGLIGRSRLSRAAKTFSSALTLNEHSASMISNGVYPSGVLQADGMLNNDQLQILKTQFKEAFSGSKNAAKAMVLDQGLKWQGMVSMSPEDAELLASRRFTGEELARIFGVPPSIVGDLSHGTFTNSETAGRWFAQHTLTPWIRKIEAEFLRSVFTETTRSTHFMDIDLSGMLRGDPETRWKSHEIAVRNEILTPNEIREVEGWNPRPDKNKMQEEPAE